MKKIFLISLAAVFLGGIQAYSAEKTPEAITIGFLPGGDEGNIKKGSVEIAQALQEELHIPVKVYLSKNYSGLVEAMKAKKVDFAFFTAMSYVAAEKEAGAKVLLKKVWSGPFYYSAILTRADSKIKKLEMLQGKKIAFVDEKSTSGYLYPQVLFKKKNITFKDVQFSGSHSQSVALLDEGNVDAIAVFADDKQGLQNAYVKYSKKAQVKKIRPDKLVSVVWVSDPIPNDPFCVRQDFYDQYPKITHNLMFALIDVVDKLKGTPGVPETLGAQGFVPATQRQYDPVREMVKEFGLQPQ
jgi:phosphonate transport system substrate-binding protein